MKKKINRRDFVTTGAAAGVAVATGRSALAAASSEHNVSNPVLSRSPEMLSTQGTTPMVISDYSGFGYRNGGTMNAVEKAFQMITEGEDVLDAVIAGVNIPENDPTETGIGYGGLPNERGVVQLDACCMHGPKKRAGGVAGLEGVRTPSLVAKAVADYTDHHLLVGQGAQDFARNIGFEVEADLNTDRSRNLWLEWRQRVDPEHYLDPDDRPIRRRGGRGIDADGVPGGIGQSLVRQRDLAWRGYQVALDMVREGLIPEHSFWGTINCNGINAAGEICGVTTTSGLSWKIPGRAGDSPILGAGLYVDGDVGACGSTGRGEANLFNLSSFLIVEKMRDGMHPKDAAIEGLRRIRTNTIEERLLNSRGEPAFNVRFFALDKQSRYTGVQMYGGGQGYAICTENGAELIEFDYLLEGSPVD